MASYVFARICDERHISYEVALEDISGLITDELYYTRNETPPKIMRRTPNADGRDRQPRRARPVHTRRLRRA